MTTPIRMVRAQDCPPMSRFVRFFPRLEPFKSGQKGAEELVTCFGEPLPTS